MYIVCPRCGTTASLAMIGTDGRTYAKCLECGKEASVKTMPKLVALPASVKSRPLEQSEGAGRFQKEWHAEHRAR